MDVIDFKIQLKDIKYILKKNIIIIPIYDKILSYQACQLV